MEHRSSSLMMSCVGHWRERVAVRVAKEARRQASLSRCRVGGAMGATAGRLELLENAERVGLGFLGSSLAVMVMSQAFER